MGWLLIRLGDLDAARGHLVQAKAFFEEFGIELQKGEILLSIAQLELAEGNLAAATSNAIEAIDLATSYREVGTVSEAHTLLGRVADREGRDADADAQFTAALDAAEPIGGHWLMDVHEAYAAVLESRGDLPNANRHLKLAIAAFRPANQAIVESQIAIA
jgi:tetratricopeptide (TPR) repeat protein